MAHNTRPKSAEAGRVECKNQVIGFFEETIDD